MAFCNNCGIQLANGARFCQRCGAPVVFNNGAFNGNRQQSFYGGIYKCPNCGQILNSFVRNCPTCGLELRGTMPTSAVREFALKLEAIESRRGYEPPNGFDYISKTDEQKISLIQSFLVPNTKEDMLEFMILATSNVNYRSYDSTHTISKSERAINDAWISKIKQVYEKAKRTYGNEKDFLQIESLYKKCNADIGKAKKKSVVKWIAMFALVPAICIAMVIGVMMIQVVYNAKETARLESIEKVAVEALENGEYKKALLNAESLVYDYVINVDKRKWDIKRRLLVDEIIAEAEKHGMHLVPSSGKEVARLESIEKAARDALKDREYKKALINAEGLVYSLGDEDEIERQWDVKREVLIDEIIKEAEKNGVHLERSSESDKKNDDINRSRNDSVKEETDDINRTSLK